MKWRKKEVEGVTESKGRRGERCREGDRGRRSKRGQGIKGTREGVQERTKRIRMMYEKRGEEEIY